MIKSPFWMNVGAVLLLLAILVATIIRIQRSYQEPKFGKFDTTRQGLCDFHNGIYFPSRAFLDGVNPYGPSYPRQFPVPHPIPPYAPSTLVLHAPLAILPLRAAEIVYVLFSFALVGLMAAACNRYALAKRESQSDLKFNKRLFDWTLPGILFWAIGLLASRSGHTTLFNGYLTLEVVIGTFAAIYAKSHQPWMSGLGFALAAVKPQHAIPLALLMLARKRWKGLFIGIALTSVLSLIALGWLVQQNSWSDVRQSLFESQQGHLENDFEKPATNWSRTDFLALIAKWLDWVPDATTHLLIMFPLIAPALYLCYRLERESDRALHAEQWIGLIAMLGLLVSVYHHIYDALLLCLPLAGLIGTSAKSTRIEHSLIFIFLAVGFSYFSSDFVLSRLPINLGGTKILSSVVPLLLTVAYIQTLFFGYQTCLRDSLKSPQQKRID